MVLQKLSEIIPGSWSVLLLAGVLAFSSYGKPNIVLILADDLGFSNIGCYGSEIHTPNIDSLAAKGLRFTQFYNGSKCSPSRTSIMTGLFCQQIHPTADVYELDTNCVTIGQVLKAAGYRTLMVGKWHQGPNSSLAVKWGFDKYYGVTGGLSNYFNPGDQRPGEPAPVHNGYRAWANDSAVLGFNGPNTAGHYTPGKGFYATDAFGDTAVSYLERYKNEDKPFFLYLAFNAPHYPLQAWPEDIAKYSNVYASGYDTIRHARYNRLVNMGLIDSRWALHPSEYTTPWNMLSDSAKKAEALTMSVFAAMVDRMDQNIGKVMAKIRALGKENNTLVIFLSDNGGCRGGDLHIGPAGPGPLNGFHVNDPSWGNVMNTPFRRYKESSSHGGMATPFIACWPGVIAQNTIEKYQVGHIVDIMATLCDVAGTSYPSTFNGHQTRPSPSISLAPVFYGKKRQDHDVLFWSYWYHKGVRKGDWKVVSESQTGDVPRWSLFNMADDLTEVNDLSKTYPKKTDSLGALWFEWAAKGYYWPPPATAVKKAAGRAFPGPAYQPVCLLFPESGTLAISISCTSWHKLEILNCLGKSVFKKNGHGPASYIFSVKERASAYGIYVVQVRHAGGTFEETVGIAGE